MGMKMTMRMIIMPAMKKNNTKIIIDILFFKKIYFNIKKIIYIYY